MNRSGDICVHGWLEDDCNDCESRETRWPRDNTGSVEPQEIVDFGDFSSVDPYERWQAHQRAKGRSC